jgi:hypothetical protein
MLIILSSHPIFPQSHAVVAWKLIFYCINFENVETVSLIKNARPGSSYQTNGLLWGVSLSQSYSIITLIIKLEPQKRGFG